MEFLTVQARGGPTWAGVPGPTMGPGPVWVMLIIHVCWAKTHLTPKSQNCLRFPLVTLKLWDHTDFPGLRSVWLRDQGSLGRRPWQGTRQLSEADFPSQPLWKEKTNKTENNKCWWRCERIGTPCTDGENVTWSSHSGKQYSCSSKN